MTIPVKTEFFDLKNGGYFCCEPGGRWHGWLFRKHPDGQFVSIMKTELVENPYRALASHQEERNI
jgi:hypothetical protein